jgi:hypothetical protein
MAALLKTQSHYSVGRRLLILTLKSFKATIDRSDMARQVSNATIMDVAVVGEIHPTPRF